MKMAGKKDFFLLNEGFTVVCKAKTDYDSKKD